MADQSPYERAVAHLAALYDTGPNLVAYASAFETVLATFPNVLRTELALDVVRRRRAA